MNPSDKDIEKLRRRLTEEPDLPLPEPLIALPVRTYSELLGLLSRMEGLLCATGLQLKVCGEPEWGSQVVVEADRMGKRVQSLVGQQGW